MKTWRLAGCLLLGIATASACGSSSPSNNAPIVDNPYETCYAGDICASGLTCAATTLPASSGYTGYFCTSGCTYDVDCLQVPTNYSALCVNGQCYLGCLGMGQFGHVGGWS
jgi:hypothetical protein